jgi:multidrug resistance efflux pump
VPLLSLVDLNDVWIRFDLREDLVKGLKVGDQFTMRVPALGDLVGRAMDDAARLVSRKDDA